MGDYSPTLFGMFHFFFFLPIACISRLFRHLATPFRRAARISSAVIGPNTEQRLPIVSPGSRHCAAQGGGRETDVASAAHTRQRDRRMQCRARLARLCRMQRRNRGRKKKKKRWRLSCLERVDWDALLYIRRAALREREKKIRLKGA